MRPTRIVAALIAAPLLGAVTYIAVAGVDGSRMSFGPSKNDVVATFIGLVVVAVLFEVFVLLPAAVLIRKSVRFEVWLCLIGIIAWLGLVAGGFLLLGQGAGSVAILSVQFLSLGAPLLLLFVVLIRRVLHA
jgi:hypothetical protein